MVKTTVSALKLNLKIPTVLGSLLRKRTARLLLRPCPSLPVTEQRLVLRPNAHCSDRLTIVAVVGVHAAIARRDVEGTRVVRTARVERTRPVEPAATCVVETAITAVASGRKEECLTVHLRGEETALFAILPCPLVCSVLQQFIPLGLGRRAPTVAPIGRGDIILGQQGG